MAKEATRVRRRERKNIASGVAHVASTFNNTMITITDAQGNTIAWSSAGTMGFKGSRKSTPYAAQMAAEDAAKKASEHGMRTIEVEVSGPGSGRESALRALQGRQQHPAQGIAQGDAEAALERFSDDTGLAGGIGAGFDLRLLRTDQLVPVSFDHVVGSLERGSPAAFCAAGEGELCLKSTRRDDAWADGSRCAGSA